MIMWSNTVIVIKSSIMLEDIYLSVSISLLFLQSLGSLLMAGLSRIGYTSPLVFVNLLLSRLKPFS